jgi:hypothetical protein
MNKTFQVGNLVIMQKGTHYFEYDDLPAVIIKPLTTRWCLDLNTMQQVQDGVYGIRILTPDGLEVLARPWQLKRLVAGGEKSWRARKSIKRPKYEELETEIS